MPPFEVGGVTFSVSGIADYITAAVGLGLTLGVMLVLFTLLYGRVR